VRLPLVALLAAAAVPPGAEPVPVDGRTGILAAPRPLVAFLETHGSEEQHRFLRSLVEDDRFGRAFDDVVVEFGSARYQVTIDRYVRGERVSAASLARVWTRTTQTSGVWNAPVYRDFFAAVRRANLQRPPEERVRVLLGDPTIDWRRIRRAGCPRRPGRDCLDWWIGRRNEHYARVVLDKVLARGRRALLIAGAFHLVRPPAGPFANETALIERARPGSVYAVKPHERFGGPDAEELERRVSRWPAPALVDVRGTWLGAVPAGQAFGEGSSVSPAGSRSASTVT
jgi:hypothetical protein